MKPIILYLIRHATPDWSRTDLPYHLPPGPPLTPQGQAEARALGDFLRGAGMVRLFASPLERAWRTAEIAAGVAGQPWEMAEALLEWQPGENADGVRVRLGPVWEQAVQLAGFVGPVGLVTHGGPIAATLEALGLPGPLLADYKKRFDRSNPLPPAGAWRAVRPTATAAWELELAYLPEAVRQAQVT